MTVSLKKFIVGSMIVSAALSASAALAHDNTNTASTTETPKPTKVLPTTKKALDLPCAAAAVAKREAAVSAAFGTKSSAISTAFTKRASDLAAAWAITTAKDRNVAVKAAWKTFNESSRAAKKAYVTANNAAWKTFRTEAKACRASTSLESAGGMSDATL